MIGGLVMGVLSALPLVSAANLCCCLWVVCGGAVAAYLLQQNQATPIEPGDGALIGLFAGVIGTFVYMAISVPLTILMAPIERQVLERVFERFGDVPPELRDYAMNPLARLAFIAVDFVLRLVTGAIFSTLGGLLGAVIFRRKPAPESVDVPPSA